jgi:hypothetical protein
MKPPNEKGRPPEGSRSANLIVPQLTTLGRFVQLFSQLGTLAGIAWQHPGWLVRATHRRLITAPLFRILKGGPA